MMIMLGKNKSNVAFIHYLVGLGLIALITTAAMKLGSIPYISMIGPLVIAIILGMVWRATIGIKEVIAPSILFSSKHLLRLGIIFLGMRLNIMDVYTAGTKVFLVGLINLVFALGIMYILTKLFQVERKLSVLLACGTAICGAAAILAIAPLINAKDEDTAIGAATVALLGTVFTLLFTFLYPIMPLTAQGYGIFTGGTLHEVAHVVAAAGAGGEAAVDMAVIVKLTRVALLVPIATFIGYIANRNERVNMNGTTSARIKIPWSIFPWFIIGFIVMSGLNTFANVSSETSNHFVTFAYFLLGMAMTALGLNVDFKTFRQRCLKPIKAGLMGSVLLALLGYSVVFLLHLNG